MVMERDLRSTVAGSNSGGRADEYNPGQVVYTCASVTKQHNLVPAKLGGDARWLGGNRGPGGK